MQYLLTFYKGEQFVAVLQSSSDMAHTIGNELSGGAVGFKAYCVTPDGITPLQLYINVQAIAVNVVDQSGHFKDTAKYRW